MREEPPDGSAIAIALALLVIGFTGVVGLSGLAERVAAVVGPPGVARPGQPCR